MIRFLLCIALAASASAAPIHVPRDHPSIQAAIDAVTSGAEIRVAPGTYKERITLKPGVLLFAIEGAEKTVIDGRAGPEDQPGVRMAKGATLHGFSVTGVGAYDEALWQKHWETRGENQTHDHIGEFGVPGISVEDVHCTVVSNRVHHNGFTGIAVRGTHASPEIAHNTCFRNMGGGIGLMQGATGRVVQNTCYENFYAGIGHDDARPMVVSNRCYGNVRAGIGISEGAQPTVTGNWCYENRRAGIGVRTGTNTHPLVIGNQCYRNGMAGIGVKDDARAWLNDNVCYANKLAGIGARNGANIILTNNHCYDNAASGVGLGPGGGVAMLGNNLIVSNQTVQVGIQPGWEVRMLSNELRSGTGLPPVIMVFAGANADLTDNTLEGAGVAALRVAGEVRLVGNRLIGRAMRKGGPPHFGIWALPGADVQAFNNEITHWRHGIVADQAKLRLENNTIKGYHPIAVRIDGKAVE